MDLNTSTLDNQQKQQDQPTYKVKKKKVKDAGSWVGGCEDGGGGGGGGGKLV